MTTRPTLSTLTVLGTLLVSTLSQAAPLTLGKYIPADVHFYGNWRPTRERAHVMEAYSQAVVKLVDSGIEQDIFDLATAAMELSDSQRSEALSVIRRIIDLLQGPNWRELTSREVALAFKIAMPFPEYLVVFKVEESAAAERLAELRELLGGISEFVPDQLTVTESSRQGAEISRMQLGPTPFAVSVAAKRDVVLISTSERLLDGVFQLVDAKDTGGSIVEMEGFRTAFVGLPEPQDGQVYFDLAGYMEFFRGMLGPARSWAGKDPNAAGAISIADTIIEELARMRSVAMVERTQGDRLLTDIRVTLVQKDGPGFIEQLVASQRPVTNFSRVVPRDAVGFYLSSGVDMAKVYEASTDLIRERIPEGKELLDQWERLQETLGFHLHRDLLSWLEGGFGWISLPGRPAGSGGENVFFLRVRDDEKARKIVKSVLARAKGFLESRGQPIEFAPLTELGEEMGEQFREVRIASLPFFRPVIGMPSGVLVVGSSVDAIRRVVATYREEAEGILENPRFRAVAVPEGQLSEVFYQDLEGYLSGFANVLGGIGFVCSVLPEDHDTKPLLKLGAVLTKLSTFVRDIDIGIDYAGWTLYDPEQHAFLSRQMVRLRVPGPKVEEL